MTPVDTKSEEEILTMSTEEIAKQVAENVVGGALEQAMESEQLK